MGSKGEQFEQFDAKDWRGSDCGSPVASHCPPRALLRQHPRCAAIPSSPAKKGYQSNYLFFEGVDIFTAYVDVVVGEEGPKSRVEADVNL